MATASNKTTTIQLIIQLASCANPAAKTLRLWPTSFHICSLPHYKRKLQLLCHNTNQWPTTLPTTLAKDNIQSDTMAQAPRPYEQLPRWDVPLFYCQSMIGWTQLSYSKFAIQWLQWLTTHSNDTNGTHFYANACQSDPINLADHFHLCNKHLHDPTNMYKATHSR